MISRPRILVCTDFSEAANLALLAAEKMRKKTNGIIHVLHVNEFPLQWDWVSSEAQAVYLNQQFRLELKESQERRLLEQIRSCEAVATGEVLEGEILHVIMEQIKKLETDFVFISHQGISHTPFHIGGIATKIIASSPRPVFVIKKPSGASKMAGLVDVNEMSKKLIDFCEEFSHLYHSQLEFISLWRQGFTRFFNLTSLNHQSPLLNLNAEEQKVILNKMKDIIQHCLLPDSKATIQVFVTQEKKISEELLDKLLEHQVDLVVMERHQKGKLEKFLLGSETRRMLELYPGNLIILPPQS